jgi:phosphoglycolate phosphatase
MLNVLFDLDGTLTDPREGIVACLKYALLGLGHNYPSDLDLALFIGPPLQESFAALLHSTDPKQINAAVELYRQRFTSKGILENTVYPGIHAALTTLQERGALLFVATSKPRVFAERIVEHFGLKKHFCAVYGGELDGARSDKGLIAYVLKADSLSPDSTVMVGDRAHDIMGAKAQGVFPVGVLWGYGSYDELIAAGATTLCEQPEMLDEILLSNSKLNPRSQGSASHCEHRNFIGGKNDK